ncbi:hypothetical protein SNEBB_000919 [Seison nebaliae]|nr:hypothetical protein SNEBB_000919 [Seison nebaliae]
MGSNPSLTLRAEEIVNLEKETGFNGAQIKRLYSRFTSLDKHSNGFLTRDDLLRIPDLAINPLGERIVDCFFDETDDDSINFKNFCDVLAVFLKQNRNVSTKEKVKNDDENDNGENEMEEDLNCKNNKLKFLFKIYDKDRDGKISRTELFNILHMMVGTNISEEQLENIVDRLLGELDKEVEYAKTINFIEFQKLFNHIDINEKNFTKNFQ